MTDPEFDLLVSLAQLPPEERETLLASRQPRWFIALRSSAAQDVLRLLRGAPARGSAAEAWFTLVEQEATRSARQPSATW